jgi:superfamily II DNA or RNA helicase
MLSKQLKSQHIKPFFNAATFEKARDLHRNRRVLDLEVAADGHQIAASVQGSENWPYDVEIKLKPRSDGGVNVSGTCSCPMGHNCKHVAAALLEALANRPPESERGQKPPMQSAPVLSAEINAWLEALGKVGRGETYPDDVRQRLLFRLQRHGGANEAPYAVASLLSVRLRKDDSFSDQVHNVTNTQASLGQAPAFYRDSDIEICRQLLRHGSVLLGKDMAFKVNSAELMKRIVETGRAYWRDTTRPALCWGNDRPGHIVWQQVGPRGIGGRLAIDGAVALNAVPPLYVDEAAGVIGVIDTGIAPQTAHQLINAPILPPAVIGEVARRLKQRLPSLDAALLPAPPAEAVKIEAKPVPILRLLSGSEAGYGYGSRYDLDDDPLGLASLSFRYGPVEIEATAKQAEFEAFHDGRIHAVTRSRADEKKTSKRLTELGFISIRRLVPYIEAEYAHTLTLEDEGRWLQFVHLQLDELRQEGFEIRIDDDFPYRLVSSSGFVDTEIEGSGIDWFELGFKVDVDGKPHDLAGLLTQLLTRGDILNALTESGATAKHMYVPLPDGRNLALAAGRFLPVLLALQTLRLNGGSFGKSGRIKLSRAEIVPLLTHESAALAFDGHDELRKLADLVRLGRQDDPVLPAGFTATLRPYQQQGVAWLDMLREANLGGVLADDMGLGKTVQVLALLALEKARGALRTPVLIVAPTSLMTNWFNEAQKFVPDLKVLVFHGISRKQSTEQIAEHDVVLTTYPLIARDHELLLAREWHMAILDEAQTIKNPNAATTRWLSAIKASHRFCLTGTPMENHLGELWSIMSFANPGYLGDKAAFTRNWRTPIEKNADQTRAAALTRRIKPFLLRRTKEEVAAELPAKTEIVEIVAIEGRQRDLYDSIRVSMAEKVRKALEERGLARSHIIVLEALLRLRQVCCDPRLLKLDDGTERPSAKLDRLMEMVDELLSEGRKIIIFSQFTSMLALIEARFEAAKIGYALLTGETRDRKRPIEAFQNGNRAVFLISLKAGGVGLNLTAADTVILYDPWWNPAVEAQAVDRAHRIGQDKKVFVYRLVTAGTIEEKIGELKARKQALADSLFDKEGNIGKALTEDDVAALLS